MNIENGESQGGDQGFDASKSQDALEREIVGGSAELGETTEVDIKTGDAYERLQQLAVAQRERLGGKKEDIREVSALETEITSIEQIIDARQGFAANKEKDPEKRDNEIIVEATTILLGRHEGASSEKMKSLATKALRERGFDPSKVRGDNPSVGQFIDQMRYNKNLEDLRNKREN